MSAVGADRVACVLVGVGRMGQNHLRVLRESRSFEVVATIGPHLDAETRGPVRHARSLDELGALEFDCAVIAAPTARHHALALELLGRGKHALVEKPLARTSAQCAELVALAEARGVHLAVGHVERFNPAIRALRGILAEGVLGTPVHLSATRAGPYPTPPPPDSDVLAELAVHDLDLARWLLGPLTVRASVRQAVRAAGTCDVADVLLASPSGAVAAVHASWLAPTKLRALRVTGTRGVAVVDCLARACTVLGQPHHEVLPFDALAAQLEQLHALITRGEEGDLCLGRDATAAVQLVEDAHRDPRP